MFRLSLSAVSCLAAVGLALWEVYFFWFAPHTGTGLAWLVLLYLSFQLLSIPFAINASGARFIGVIDAMASLVPLAVVLVVMFGKSYLVATGERWEAAIILLLVCCVDLFGGYVFNIALSRRTVDYLGPAHG